MLGVLVAIVISWSIRWLWDKKHLTVLGIVPTWSGVKLFGLGALVMALFCTVNLVGQAFFMQVDYVINESNALNEALFGTRWTFKVALFEELIFRGALLHIAIRRIGPWKACLISVVFLSSGPLGNSLFVPNAEGVAMNGWGELAFFLWQTVAVPGLVIWYFARRYTSFPD